MVWQTDAASQYDFPVGKTTPYIQYQPVSLVRTTVVGNASFTAEFVAASPIGPQYGNMFADPILQGIFSNRYWTVTKDYIPVNAGDKGVEARLMINYASNPGPSGWVPLAPSATSNVAVASWSPATIPTAEVPGYWGFTKNGFDFNTSGGTYLEAIYNMSAGPVYSSPVTSFNAFTIGFGSAFVLPAILLSFDAALVNGTDGRLRWAVSDVGSLAGFELFHSTDGINFTPLSSIHGNEGVTYTYTHTLLAKGKHYYKLRLQDKNGTFRYSAIKVIQVDKGVTYIKGIRATLIDKDIHPIIFSAGTQKASIVIIDAAGKLLLQQQLTLQNGANEYPIRIGQLAAGIYFLRVATADGVMGSLQFLKK